MQKKTTKFATNQNCKKKKKKKKKNNKQTEIAGSKT